MQRHDRLYIDGAWVAPAGDRTIEVVDPTTEQVLASVPEGTAADVDRAVAAARRAFGPWAATPPKERAAYLAALAEKITEHSEELAGQICREVGTPLKVSRAVQVKQAVQDFENTAAALADYQFEETVGNSLVVREPAGVVGAITPWNYPLHQVTAKVAPALAAGCTMVLKPSELAPLSALALAGMADEVGLPAGVLNVVTGTGAEAGAALVIHPDVDMVSFTGSVSTGRQVAAAAAAAVKRVALELGGKSPNVLLDDLDDELLTKAVSDGLGKCFLNAGQTCNALTRMLVPRARLADVEAAALSALQRWPVGDPSVDGVRVGPLVSAAQRERVRAHIAGGLREGARLVAGGTEPPDGLGRGFFVRPTVLSDVRNDMAVAQEEIFGPVLVIVPYDTEDEAVELANDSRYGLAGGVWSADPARAEAVARRLRTGQVEVNGGRWNPVAPFGGYKQSGNSRELGRWGLDEYVELKSIQR